VRLVDRIVDSRWSPVAIFDTGARPIYYPPSVIFVSELGAYALAWGTGDREDLWRDLPVDGRFFVLLDNGLGSDPSIAPLGESKLELIDAEASKKASPQGNLLTDPDTSSGKVPGWALSLEPNERVVAKSFGLAGVLFFNSYLPELNGENDVCSSAGSSRLYTVFATNGLGIRSTGERYREVADFTTRPFVEASGGVKKNDSGGDPEPPPDACDSEELAAMAESIKSLMPSECKFANYRLNVMTLESLAGLECLVPVPVCVIERNWKEF
jgi:Tfp pilus tip-associated adhesin PilY1